MASGYKILWTDHALRELSLTFEYLEQNFTKKELTELSIELNLVLGLISKSPKLFPESNSKNVRKVVVKKYNTLYYRLNNSSIEILSFFSNRQNPKKIKNK